MSDDPASRPARRRPARTQGGLLQAVLSLTAAQQRTAAAAIVVLVSLGTPWYTTEVVFPGKDGGPPTTSSGTMSGIGAFSFVEAAVLLVAAAVLVLVWARATERRFSLPVADGTVITAAAGWLGLLVVYRLFDKPEGDTEGNAATLIGLSWGIFASLAAVGLLLATGLDQRRRDAELRASTATPVDGPVVDPADVVPATGGDERTAVARRDDADEPAAVARRDDADDRPAWDGPAAPAARPPSVPDRPAWAGPASAPPSRTPAPADPPADPSPSRSWSYADTDGPGPPAPRTPPSRRRPTPPQDPTRPLGRGDAADQLRDAGLGDAAPRPRAAEETAPRRDDPTRVAPQQDDPTRVAPRSEEAGRHDPPPSDARLRGRRRRRDRDGG